MKFTRQRGRFRAVLTGERCIHPGSVFDPISARLAESLGFEIGMFSGSIASLAILAAPDLAVITLSEFADQAHRICRAGTLPLLVDADHGYGNALNVMRTVEELETAGVAALTIEDTLLPRPFGETHTRLISLEETVGKLRAAVRARQDPGLVIVGRSQAPGLTTIEEAVTRARAYAQTGVDAIFFGGVTTRAQLEALSAATALPIILGNVNAALADREYLATNKVKIALQGHHPIMAAVQSVHETLKALREGVAPSDLPNLATAELMDRVTRHSNYATMAKDFLHA